MFHQIRTPISGQRFLGFLWWPKGDVSLKPEVYCMTVHLFRSQVVAELCEFYATSNRQRQLKCIRQLDDRDGEKEFLHG